MFFQFFGLSAIMILWYAVIKPKMAAILDSSMAAFQDIYYLRPLYRVSQKKRNGGFSVPYELEVLYLLTSLDQTSSAEENDTKIIKFGCEVLILYAHFLKYGHFKISLDFCDRWAKNYVGNSLSL